MSDSATMPAAALRRTDLPKLSLGTKTAATLLAIVAAVVLPQLFHVIGAVSGQGTMLGVAFLPMHLPIIFVGLIAGPAVGAIAGAAAPLVSFLLSGMPMLAMLPLMMVELCAYAHRVRGVGQHGRNAERQQRRIGDQRGRAYSVSDESRADSGDKHQQQSGDGHSCDHDRFPFVKLLRSPPISNGSQA